MKGKVPTIMSLAMAVVAIVSVFTEVISTESFLLTMLLIALYAQIEIISDIRKILKGKEEKHED